MVDDSAVELIENDMVQQLHFSSGEKWWMIASSRPID